MVVDGYVAVLDPFSTEGKAIARDAPPFDSLPHGVVKKAVDRIREIKETLRSEAVEFDEQAIREDVLSFYLMCQGVASVSYPYSAESRFVTEATKALIMYRMYDLFKRGYEDLCLDAVRRSFRLIKLEGTRGVKIGNVEVPESDLLKLRDRALGGREVKDDRELPQYTPKYAIRWTDFALLLRHRRADLTKLYVVNGWAVITPRELWDFFAEHIAARTEEYITSLYERFSDRPVVSKTLEEVGKKIAELTPRGVERDRFVAPRGQLHPSAFPPCVRAALGGVGAGARNYAITVLLTSFLSYARVSPSGKLVVKISDFIDDISVVKDEIVPLIFEAAEKCRPPLFKDQPQEKANIYYHLGFGMTTNPRMSDSGRSKWYRTPNCRKIRTAVPSLCNPDELCRKIRNPLTYYYKKLAEKSRESR